MRKNMKKSELKAPSLTLQAGFFTEQEYETYNEMAESSTENWTYHCTYELRPKALTGKHQILSLENMLISLGKRPGGMMHDVLSAEGTITLGVQCYVEDKSTFDTLKLQSGDILIFDDSKAYNYMTNKKVELAVVTIRKETFGEILPLFSAACLHKMVDTEGRLEALLKETWKTFTSTNPSNDFKGAEEKIMNLLKQLITEQEPQVPLLSKSEEIAYAIRKQLYKHMDGNLKVSDLAEQHNISERGLQNAFNSLFGFTPKRFMLQLKLNLVRHELSYEVSEETTVMRVAHKWGFAHMGRFSKYYTELFEENPSETLKRSFSHARAFTGECVERQEEIE
jgi:AraC-like DNA-binding protein